jgi:hypothetical protein
MNAISITRTETPEQGTRYHAKAVRGGQEAVGRTRGEALDAIAAQLNLTEDEEMYFVAEMKPDEFFTAQQIERLCQLRDKLENGTLTESEDAEFTALVEAELLASGKRVASLMNAIGQ